MWIILVVIIWYLFSKFIYKEYRYVDRISYHKPVISAIYMYHEKKNCHE